MVQSYEEAVNYIHSFMPFGIKPGLKRMEWMLERFGNPERRLKCVHIGGTNGKGSTVNYMRAILQDAGYVVGTFTSPYIESFNERISINGKPIEEEHLIKLVNDVKPVVEAIVEETELGSPTEFEIITLISLLYFATVSHPDIILYEVGLGGRFDSTNVIHPLLSIITNVSYDHMNILGSSLQEIAFEKAGIIKSGVPLITAENKAEALDVIRSEAVNKKAKIYQLGDEFVAEEMMSTRVGERFSFQSLLTSQKFYDIAMKGFHQVKNASVALMAIHYLRTYYSLIIDDENIRNGLKEAKWIGRFEQLSENPLLIIDGAHNVEGVQSLAQTLATHYPTKKKKVIFAANKDKDTSEMLQSLYQGIDHITFTTFDFHRAASAEMLFEQSPFTNKSFNTNWKDLIIKSINNLQNDEMLIITGSLYFVSDVRFFIKNEKEM